MGDITIDSITITVNNKKYYEISAHKFNYLEELSQFLKKKKKRKTKSNRMNSPVTVFKNESIVLKLLKIRFPGPNCFTSDFY
jgi:hypothetical protein